MYISKYTQILIHVHNIYKVYICILFLQDDLMYNKAFNKVFMQIWKCKLHKKVYSAHIATVKKTPWLSSAISVVSSPLVNSSQLQSSHETT